MALLRISTAELDLLTSPSARIWFVYDFRSDVCMRMPSLAWLAATQFVSLNV